MGAATIRILLVEDNPHVREMFTYGLEKAAVNIFGAAPVEVMSAADGQEALEKLNAHEFHILVTDIYMPIMDGKELMRKIRTMPNQQKIKILAVSASSVNAPAEAAAAGADLFLRKPVRMTDLVQAVTELAKQLKP
jgi:CheY-like chemotaxis protein